MNPPAEFTALERACLLTISEDFLKSEVSCVCTHHFEPAMGMLTPPKCQTDKLMLTNQYFLAYKVNSQNISVFTLKI